ncbi:DUF998 domain-containing protein [Lipingzhangella sp. LS1_29]|uniref:DUF998 domain-containing protein n=1 Tax=Lipingzhangella rawalii TaxID=2055835 RepID=A0ABU2H4Q9_9ACTN|nr:DUF998 domain-containing protein [Lipingzhangella rawalii]MDS1269844.1 DUF998 domain-containing protein [Lipingzhangella rawalii]
MTVLATVGALAALGFLAVFTLDGWTRPGFVVGRHPVSALALGPRGWVQTANFWQCGIGMVVGAAGLAAQHHWLASMVGVVGLALVASGIWRMDPMRGYPPGTPDTTPEGFSRRHQWHDRAGAVVFAGVPGAALVAALGDLESWLRWYSAATAVGTAVLVWVFAAAWERDAPGAGLWQRLALLAGWIWLAVLFVSVPGA